jgi:hypothetical protein
MGETANGEVSALLMEPYTEATHRNARKKVRESIRFNLELEYKDESCT